MELIDYIKGHRDSISPTQTVNDPVLKKAGISMLIKRDDLIDEHISGNKWRKLCYNIQEALQYGRHTVLTFGGAYSNHIVATANACRKAGLDSIGIIRGEDDPTNPSLKFARQNGMQLHFVSRSDYRMKNEAGLLCELKKRFGRFFMIPEGGANNLGVKGCTEILQEVDEHFDVVCCAMGTGTTAAGLALSLTEGQQLLGFSALKGGTFLMNGMASLIAESGLRPSSAMDYRVMTDYHFGGFAKMTPELLRFILDFQERTGIPLDPLYTGKMMFGIYDMIRKGSFTKGTVLLAVHTGGLQGWKGMKHRGLV